MTYYLKLLILFSFLVLPQISYAINWLTECDTFLSLREGPSVKTKRLTLIQCGSALPNLIKHDESWYKVTYDDYTGYVHKRFIEILADE